MASDARIAIENLRSGVPGPEVAALLHSGRDNLLDDIEQDWKALEAGSARRGRNRRVIAANYGDGKSHLLYLIRERARARNWLTSFVVISREAPLDRLDRLYRKVAARTFLPGTDRPGIAPLLERLADAPERAQEALYRLKGVVHPKITMALEARLLYPGGDQEDLDEDLSGFFRSSSQVSQLYRERTGHRPYRMDRFRPSSDAADYFRMVDTLAAAAGMGGWCILFDEVELIGSLSRRARGRSYAAMAQLMDSAFLPHTYTVWSLASNFRTDLLSRLDEAATLPAWLAERGLSSIAEKVLEPIDALSGAATLRPMSEDDLRTVFSAIVAAHGSAYAWQPELTGDALLAAIRRQIPMRDAKVRQLVRAAVQYLDIMHLYGEEPALRLDALAEPVVTPASNVDEEADDAIELSPREAVRRIWPVD